MGRAWNEFLAGLAVDKSMTDQMNAENDQLRREMDAKIAASTPSAEEIADAVVDAQRQHEWEKQFAEEYMAKYHPDQVKKKTASQGDAEVVRLQQLLADRNNTIADQSSQMRALQQQVDVLTRQLKAKGQQARQLEQKVAALEQADPLAAFPTRDPDLVRAWQCAAEHDDRLKREYLRLAQYHDRQADELEHTRMNMTYQSSQLDVMQRQLKPEAAPEGQRSLVERAREHIDEFKRLQTDYMAARAQDLPQWILEERSMLQGAGSIRSSVVDKPSYQHDTGHAQRQQMARAAGAAAGYVASMADDTPEKQALSDELAQAWKRSQDFELTAARAHDDIMYGEHPFTRTNPLYRTMTDEVAANEQASDVPESHDDEPGLG